MNETESLQQLGKRIAQERIHAELTQQALADKAAISLATLSKAERGYPMTTSTLFRILNALGQSSKLPDLFPEAVINPIALLKLKQTRERIRPTQ
ncbi:MAG: helix-turn-helix domain-containing protein [Opitutaceae bacterium]